MKKLLFLLLFLYTQPSLALTKYFCHIGRQELAYAEQKIEAPKGQQTEAPKEEQSGKQQEIELNPLSYFEIPDDLEESLASLDQAEPLFIIASNDCFNNCLDDRSDDSSNNSIGFLLLSDEPFIMVKKANECVEIMTRGFNFTPFLGIDSFFSLQLDKITGVLDIKIIEDETPILEETDEKIEIKVGNLRIKIKR